MNENSTAILILAAGASKRMGKVKQLLPWKNTTLLGNAIVQAKGVKNADIFTVLGANAIEIKGKIDFTGVQVIENPNWENGLGSSLSYAVKEIDNEAQKYASLFVLLADQPLIDSEYLKTMLEAFEKSEKNIAGTKYANGVGVPVVFSVQYFKELKTLNADFGAKALLNKHANVVASISADGKARDMDTWEDYQSLFKEHG